MSWPELVWAHAPSERIAQIELAPLWGPTCVAQWSPWLCRMAQMVRWLRFEFLCDEPGIVAHVDIEMP